MNLLICYATTLALVAAVNAEDGRPQAGWAVDAPNVRARFVEVVQRIDDDWYFDQS